MGNALMQAHVARELLALRETIKNEKEYEAVDVLLECAVLQNAMVHFRTLPKYEDGSIIPAVDDSFSYR